MRIGSTLSQFRITDKLGEGGMGEVWLAEDTRLGRNVALKVLPQDFAEDPERMARFEREAKVLASLNHPKIATLFGLEDISGPESATFLVMELVEGEDLSERISRGALPVDQAVDIALQIAEALEAAHEQGIVHRDLKPANIKLKPDGTVKVLDFGLAKAWEAESADSGLSLSPTMTAHATAAGLILGTAAYMSPEQARGTVVDRRADIWSFGVVLWEMLTGRKLFEGLTVSDVLASVLKEAPDLDALPPSTPPHVRRLVRRCLEKDPKLRLRDIGEAWIALSEADEEHSSADSTSMAEDSVPWRRRLPWVTAFLATAAAFTLGAFFIGREVPEQPVIRFEASPPEGGRFHLAADNPGPVVVSPDGTTLAYCVRSADGVVQLWLRSLDEAEARPLAGTEDAQYPFWAPDSKRIGFFAYGKLRVVEAVGGPPLSLCDAAEGKGGSWSKDGVIVFAPSYDTRLHKVSDSGGEPSPVTDFDSERKDNSHRHPRFLPDGRHFLYMARAASGLGRGHAVMVGSLDESPDTFLLTAPTAVEYASGHLLFVRERTLMARPFDSSRLEFIGDAFPIVESVTLLPSGTVMGVFSASQNGVLAYQAGDLRGSNLHLVWRDRQGNDLGKIGDPGSYEEVRILPGGELAVVALEDHASGSGDVWVIDLRRELFSRFTFEPGYELGLTPTPDGKALIFAAEKAEMYTLVRKEIGGSGSGEVLYESATEVYASSVSPDGESLAIFVAGESSSWDIWILPLSDKKQAYRYIETEYAEWLPTFSPDGRWLAYVSNESGRPEVYVTAFPEARRKWQISVNGGQDPRWNPNGSEIVLHSADGGLISVRVEERDGGLLIGESSPVFDTGSLPSTLSIWDLSPDGERLLVLEPQVEFKAPNLSVVVNWQGSRDRR